MKKINQIKAGILLSYVSTGLGYIISLIYTPIMLRLLGQNEFGLYSLAASVVAYLGVLNFGFGSAYIKYYSDYKVNDEKTKIAELNGIFLTIFLALGLIAIAAGIVLALNSNVILGTKLTASELAKARILMLILVINIAVTFPSIVFNSYVTTNEKFVFQKTLLMIKQIANPFIVLPVLLLGYGSIGMVLAMTGLNITIEAINMYYCFWKLEMRFSFKNFDKKLLRGITIFSSFIFLYMINDQINWNVDKYILGIFKGTSDVAIYALGAQLNAYLISLTIIVASVFVPRINAIVSKNSSDENTELTNLFVKIGRLQYMLTAFAVMGFAVFGQTFIGFWAGNDYANSYWIALILMMPIVICSGQNAGIAIRKAKNKHKVPAIVMFFIALLNILVTIPLVKLYGAIGSAIGTFIAISANQIFINVYYNKAVGINIKLFWKEIASASKGFIIPLCFSLILLLLRKNISDILFLLLALPFTVIFYLSIVNFSFNEYEKKLFQLKRIRAFLKSK